MMRWLLVLMMAATTYAADVTMEWKTRNNVVEVGDCITVDLVLTSDEPQAVTGVDAVVEWTGQAKLEGWELTYSWVFEPTQNALQLAGLNETFDDGDARILLLPWFGQALPVATPEGFVALTLYFEALSPGTWTITSATTVDWFMDLDGDGEQGPSEGTQTQRTHILGPPTTAGQPWSMVLGEIVDGVVGIAPPVPTGDCGDVAELPSFDTPPRPGSPTGVRVP